MSVQKIVGIVVVLLILSAIPFFFGIGGYGDRNDASDTTSASETQAVVEDTASGDASTAPVAAKTVTVTIGTFVFEPVTISVNKGDSIVFTNTHGVAHTVTSDVGAGPTGLSSGNMNQNADYTFTFNDTGTYRYHCEYHPSMRATVVVN